MSDRDGVAVINLHREQTRTTTIRVTRAGQGPLRLTDLRSAVHDASTIDPMAAVTVATNHTGSHAQVTLTITETLR